jgi:hypothetical protein
VYILTFSEVLPDHLSYIHLTTSLVYI